MRAGMLSRFAIALFLTVGLAWFGLSSPLAQFNGCPAGFCSGASAAPPPAKSYSFGGSAESSASGAVLSTSINIGTASAGRCVIVATAYEGNVAVSSKL
jgi:hypothetical protein